MMEISKKSNFRFKALVVAIIATILTTTCTASFGASLSSLLGINKSESEPYYNRKVYFTGAAMLYSDGSAARLINKGKAERSKVYTEENPGCGIITIIRKGQNYPYYVAGEGWIKYEQIMENGVSKYISVDFEKVDGGLNVKTHVDGEHLEIVSDNTAVIGVEDGKLVAKGDGSTTVTIHKGEGENQKDIEVVAAVASGNIQVDIPNKSVSAQLENVTIDALDKKVRVEGEASASAGLVIGEDGTISLTAVGDGEARLKVKTGNTEVADEETGEIIQEAQYKEIARINVNGDITASANLGAGQLGVAGTVTEKLTILDKFAVALQERASVTANIPEQTVKGTAGASVLAGKADSELSEVAGADAGISYKMGDSDPKGAAEARVLGMTFGSMEDSAYTRIPISDVIAGVKGLVSGNGVPRISSLGGSNMLGNLGSLVNSGLNTAKVVISNYDHDTMMEYINAGESNEEYEYEYDFDDAEGYTLEELNEMEGWE